METPTGLCRLTSLPSSPGKTEEVDWKLRAMGAGHPSHSPRLPGCLHSPLEGGGQGSLGNVFPEGWAGARVLKDYSGRELSTLRQMSELDKGQECIHSPPSCLSLLLLLPGAWTPICSSPHLGRMEGAWGAGPGWLGPGRREYTRPGLILCLHFNAPSLICFHS